MAKNDLVYSRNKSFESRIQDTDYLPHSKLW